MVPHAGQIAWTERARAVVRALGVAEIRSYCAIARNTVEFVPYPALARTPEWGLGWYSGPRPVPVDLDQKHQ